jgi:hypothetical protein
VSYRWSGSWTNGTGQSSCGEAPCGTSGCSGPAEITRHAGARFSWVLGAPAGGGVRYRNKLPSDQITAS